MSRVERLPSELQKPTFDQAFRSDTVREDKPARESASKPNGPLAKAELGNNLPERRCSFERAVVWFGFVAQCPRIQRMRLRAVTPNKLEEIPCAPLSAD